MRSIARTVGYVVLVGVKSGQRHTDKVHKVVAGKGHGQRKRTQHDYKAEHVDTKCMHQLHNHRRCHKRTEHQHAGICAYPTAHILAYERRVAQSLYENEVGKERKRHSSKQSHGVAQTFLVVKREDNARHPLHHQSGYEGYGHAYEYGNDYAQSLVAVEQVRETERRVAGHLEHGHHNRCTQQFEHERHRGRSGHAQRVEHIEHNHVGHHYGQEYHHYLVKREVGWMHNAMSGHIHHARAHHRTYQYAERSHYQHRAELGYFGANGRV